MSDHIVATQQPFGFECLHCGGRLGLTLPVSVDEFVAASKSFGDRHRDCKAHAAAAPRRCAKCGLAENEHDVRHVFVAARGA